MTENEALLVACSPTGASPVSAAALPIGEAPFAEVYAELIGVMQDRHGEVARDLQAGEPTVGIFNRRGRTA